MFESLRIKGFKGLDDVRVPLRPLTVIVGPNAVGKSSVLEALDYLLRTTHEHPREKGNPAARLSKIFEDASPNGAAALASRRGNGDFLIEVTRGREGLSLSATTKAPGGFTLSVPEGQTSLHFPTAPATAAEFFARLAARDFGAGVRLRLDPRKLSAAHYSDSERPGMSYDGEGLASAIQWLHSLRDARIDAIEADLAKVVPSVRRVRAVRSRVSRRTIRRTPARLPEGGEEVIERVTGSRIEVEHVDHGWLDAELLSEGTLLALGLLTALRIDPPRVLLLDDVDKGLHPTAQVELVRVLRAIQEQHSIQVIATAHSPFVINELDGDEVVVMGFTERGAVVARRLSEHREWKTQREYLDVGEFWSSVGESWVRESSP